MELEELALLTDRYVEVRQDRLDADRVAAGLKEAEQELKRALIGTLIESGVGMVGGTRKKVTLHTKEKPQVADWEKVYEYMQKYDAPDLLQRRLNAGAVKLRFDEGDEIPGIEYIEVNDLSVSKL